MAKPFHHYHVNPGGQVTDPSNPGGVLDEGDDIQDQADDLMGQNQAWAQAHPEIVAAAGRANAGESGAQDQFYDQGYSPGGEGDEVPDPEAAANQRSGLSGWFNRG